MIMEREYTGSQTLHHYTEVSQLTDFMYGRMRSAWRASLYTCLRLGNKDLWQPEVEKAEHDTCVLQTLQRTKISHFITLHFGMPGSRHLQELVNCERHGPTHLDVQ